MIEALVSILVFSVGALGLAAMQLSTLSASGDNQQRSVAIWKAQELADRIRSNSGEVAEYVSQVGNSTYANIGVDSSAGVISCESSAPYKKPASICSDYVSGVTADAGATACADKVKKVNFDLWEVFCDPFSGAAIFGDDSDEGSVGLSNLEVALKQNTIVVDGNSDVEVYFEWLARESDSVEGITNDTGAAIKVKTDLCGRQDIQIDSRLDVYCLRFKP